MKNIITSIALALCIFMAGSTSAQTAAAELEKVSTAYSNARHLSMEAHVHVFKDKNDKTGSFAGKGIMRKSKGCYYSRFLNDEMIVNSRCALVIDHAQKTMDYLESAGTKNKNAGQQMPDVKQMISENDSVKYHGVKAGQKHFTFYNKRAPIVQTELYTNATTGFIEKIVYYYNQGSGDEDYGAYKAVIEYRSISLKDPGDDAFSEKKYVTRKGRAIAPAPAYKNYHLTVEDTKKL
jgi:hypothetical protein